MDYSKSDWTLVEPGKIGWGTVPHPFTVRYSDNGRAVRFIVERPGGIFAEVYENMGDAMLRVLHLIEARELMGLPA